MNLELNGKVDLGHLKLHKKAQKYIGTVKKYEWKITKWDQLYIGKTLYVKKKKTMFLKLFMTW